MSHVPCLAPPFLVLHPLILNIEMNITPRRRGKSPRPHSQPHSPVPSLLLEPSSRPTSSGGVPWEPGFKTKLVTSLRLRFPLNGSKTAPQRIDIALNGQNMSGIHDTRHPGLCSNYLSDNFIRPSLADENAAGQKSPKSKE